MLRWPPELPLGGEPKDVVAIIDQNARWLATSETPKLLLTFEPGVLATEEVVDWCRKTFRNLEVRKIGPGVHFVQEDHPEAIGDAVRDWHRRSVLGRLSLVPPLAHSISCFSGEPAVRRLDGRGARDLLRAPRLCRHGQLVASCLGDGRRVRSARRCRMVVCTVALTRAILITEVKPHPASDSRTRLRNRSIAIRVANRHTSFPMRRAQKFTPCRLKNIGLPEACNASGKSSANW
jgi:hypothetical protein